MKDGKYFKKKEIDLSKVSIFLLTDEGKKKLKLCVIQLLKILLLLCLLLSVIFIIWNVNNSKLNKRKQICDNLVSSLIFENKEALRLKEIDKQKEFAKKHGMLQFEGREYLDFVPHSITNKDRVLARLSIPECNDVYENGLDNR